MNDKQIIKKLTEELEQATKSKWVKLCDGTPEQGAEVLFHFADSTPKLTISGRFINGKFRRLESSYAGVTHWMPIPQDPQ